MMDDGEGTGCRRQPKKATWPVDSWFKKNKTPRAQDNVTMALLALGKLTTPATTRRRSVLRSAVCTLMRQSLDFMFDEVGLVGGLRLRVRERVVQNVTGITDVNQQLVSGVWQSRTRNPCCLFAANVAGAFTWDCEDLDSPRTPTAEKAFHYNLQSRLRLRVQCTVQCNTACSIDVP